MRHVPSASYSHFPDVANTAAVVTLEAIPERQRCIAGFTFSYSAAPAAESTITVANGATVVFKHYITSEGIGPVPVPLPLNIASSVGSALTVTLSASPDAKGALTLHVIE